VSFFCNTDRLTKQLLLCNISHVQDEFSRVTQSNGTCVKTNGEWPIYVILLGLINFSVLVFANIQAFRARKIELDFSESQFLFIAMICTMQVCFISIPLNYIVADTNNSASCFVRIIIIFVSCTANLLLIFVPKIKYCHENRSVRNTMMRKKASTAERTLSRHNGILDVQESITVRHGVQEASVDSNSRSPLHIQDKRVNQIKRLENENADLKMNNKKLSKHILDLENTIQGSKT